MKITVGEFKDTGINEIDIDLAVKKWNHLWWISENSKTEYREESWRLISYVRIDSPITKIKLTISRSQANDLIGKLELYPSRDTTFKGMSSWRRDKDTAYIEAYRSKKRV